MVELKLKKINKPKKGNLNNDINWFCDSFGLSTGRDVEQTSKKIIIKILKKVSEHEEIFSLGIADDLGLTQGLVNYHLRNLIDSGILIRRKKQILIRGGSLKEAVKEIRRDTMLVLQNIEDIAEEIDKELGINNR